MPHHYIRIDGRSPLPSKKDVKDVLEQKQKAKLKHYWADPSNSRGVVIAEDCDDPGRIRGDFSEIATVVEDFQVDEEPGA